jgi:predicted metal-binding protein
MKVEIPFVHNIEERTIEEIKSYLQPEVFIEYCKACKYYNKIWTCPPYDFDITKMLEDYKYAYIIGSKLYINDLGASFNELLGNMDLEYVTSEIYKAARKVLDEKLESIEKGKEHVCILLAGRCMICNSCTREKQLPCIHEEKAHFSLESLGFNVSAICEDILGDKLLWAKESLPEYFIYISGVLSQEKLDIGIL